MGKPLVSVVSLFLLLISAVAGASIKSFSVPYFEKVGNKEDIPWQIVMSLSQDNDGLLWIGTQKGLLKFDGYTFTKLSKGMTETAMTDEYIKFLATTSDNKVVIATRNNGIVTYLKNTDEIVSYTLKSATQKGLVSTNINALAADTKGGVYIGTAKGLDYISKDGDISHLNELIITELFHKNDTLWFATRKNGIYIQLPSGKVTSIVDEAGNQLTEDSYVTALFNDTHDNLWLSLRNGKIKIISPTGKVSVIENDDNPRFNNIFQITNNEVWISSLSSNKGILVIDISKKQTIKEVFANENSSIKDFFLDRSGLLWIGTNGSGLYKYNTKNTGMYTFDKNLFTKKEENLIKSINNLIELANGDILFGTRGHGVYQYVEGSQNV